MNILKERTRLLITDYSDMEKRKIEDTVASLDTIFMYEDPDKELLGLPTGMEQPLRKMFPKAKFTDNSSQYWDYAKIQPVQHNAKPRNQLQIDFINFVLENAKKKQKLAGILSPGQGKGNFASSPIPTPTGWTTMGQIKVGDRVFNAYGEPVVVTGVYPRGVMDVYEVEFNDGRVARCSLDHLWCVKRKDYGSYKIMPLEAILKNYKSYTKHSYPYNYQIPLLSSPVQYDPQPVPVHPYIVGALIGNGCLTDSQLSISSGDDFVPKKIAKLAGFPDIRYPSVNNYTYTFGTGEILPNGTHKRIQTKEFLKDLPEICGKYSYEKTIPDCYMYNSYEVRMQLLQGLLDTDGSISGSAVDSRYNVSYSSTSKKLLEQIQELIRGLGFIATIGSPDNRSDKYISGYCASVNIRVPHEFKQNLFTHPKKLAIARSASNKPNIRQPFDHLNITDIRKVGQEECICIMVDDPEHLYLCDQFIVTHNTFMASYSAIKVGLRTLIIVPTSSIKQQWADTLTGMFNVPEERINVVGGPRDFVNVDRDFTIVTQASLASLNKNYRLDDIMKANKFGTKIIDEVQMWFKNIVNIDACSNIANNWYLTGTFGRSGETENNIYQQMFGDLAIFREQQKKPTIFDRHPGNVYGMKPHWNIKMVWMSGGLSKEEIESVTNSMRYSEREGKWIRYGISVPAYMNLLIPEDGSMTKYLRVLLKVLAKAEKEVTYGRTLMLGSTISSTEIIADYARKMFPSKKVGTVHSHNSKAYNDETKASADIIVSTVSSAGTGFDAPGLSKLILFNPMKSLILTEQCTGRLRRRPDGKDTYMWDVVDKDIRQLRAWANVRADFYRRAGKSFKVIDM